jgi:hypothetical protein
MLHRLSILLILIAVLNQTFSTAVTLVAFEMNRQYISEVLCENKNRPDLHCEGKCILMQRVQNEVDKASQKGQELLNNLIEKEVIVFFETRVWAFLRYPETITSRSATNKVYVLGKSQSYLTDIFHPPALG